MSKRISWVVLALIAFVPFLAPWLPLRDPNAQPDGLVLRDLPPLSVVETVRLRDGSLRFASELDPQSSGSVRYRRGQRWQTVEPAELAGASQWRGRERYWLGTDTYGRDLLSRLLHGARVSLMVGLIAASMALVIGVVIGLLAGLFGGWVDGFLMRLTDLVLSVPRLFLALMLVALYGASLTTTIWVVAATTWMAAARLVRGEVLSARERSYVEAARASGTPPLRLLVRHLLPAVWLPVLLESTQRVGDTILLEASLSFLGLGVPPPAPSWGNLIADGRHSLLDAWWVATFPGLAIALTVILLHRVSDRTS